MENMTKEQICEELERISWFGRELIDEDDFCPLKYLNGTAAFMYWLHRGSNGFEHVFDTEGCEPHSVEVYAHMGYCMGRRLFETGANHHYTMDWEQARELEDDTND